MVGNTHPDGASFRVLQPARDLARGRQHEREAPGGSLADEPELPVVEAREMADFAQIAQHERQMVLVADAANAPDALRRGSIAQLASQRVSGVCRIRDDAAGAQDRRRLPY